MSISYTANRALELSSSLIAIHSSVSVQTATQKGTRIRIQPVSNSSQVKHLSAIRPIRCPVRVGFIALLQSRLILHLHGSSIHKLRTSLLTRVNSNGRRTLAIPTVSRAQLKWRQTLLVTQDNHAIFNMLMTQDTSTVNNPLIAMVSKPSMDSSTPVTLVSSKQITTISNPRINTISNMVGKIRVNLVISR